MSLLSHSHTHVHAHTQTQDTDHTLSCDHERAHTDTAGVQRRRCLSAHFCSYISQ